MVKLSAIKPELTTHWWVVGITLVLLIGYIVACQLLTQHFPPPLPESERMMLRSFCYVAGILLMPLTNLIRHVQIRLNETMPGSTPPHQRYLLTIMVSMLLMHGLGLLGVVMFVLGDGLNTLSILMGMAILGIVLYRPKNHEYLTIVESLEHRQGDD